MVVIGVSGATVLARKVIVVSSKVFDTVLTPSATLLNESQNAQVVWWKSLSSCVGGCLINGK